MSRTEKIIRFLIYAVMNALVMAMFFLGPIVIMILGGFAIWIGLGNWGSVSYSMIAMGVISIFGAGWCIWNTWGG